MNSMIRIFTYLAAFVLLSTTNVHAQTETIPTYFTQKDWDSRSLSDAANHFVKIGEIRAAAQLKKIASRNYMRSEIDLTFRVACICRILWENGETPIRQPSLGWYGGGVSINNQDKSDLVSWPRFPVAKSGKTYFVVVHGGRGGTGLSWTGRMQKYIDYCMESGSFLEDPIPHATHEVSKANAKSLRASKRWKGKFSRKSDGQTWKSIGTQIPKLVAPKVESKPKKPTPNKAAQPKSNRVKDNHAHRLG